MDGPKTQREVSMRVKDAAARIGCGLSTAYGLIASGQIAHRRVGSSGRGVIIIDEEALADYLARVERPAEGGGEGAAPSAPRPAGFKNLDGRRLLDAWRRRGAPTGRRGGRSAPSSE